MKKENDEHYPKSTEIITSLPRPLIICGCIWMVLCLILLISVCTLQYSHKISFTVLYLGQYSKNENLVYLKLEEFTFDPSIVENERKIRFEINNDIIDGYLIDIIEKNNDKLLIVKMPIGFYSNLVTGSKGKACIEIRQKPLIESIRN